mmetsp:Transcript_3537/g.8648  ORF Transcript_3537/g.8648 Transcript_3537/m.8648 type:complete len:249 (+) Transcript_3537:1956-2702(+)
MQLRNWLSRSSSLSSGSSKSSSRTAFCEALRDDLDAECRHVRPVPSLERESRWPPCSTRNFTTSKCPCCAARWRQVQPLTFFCIRIFVPATLTISCNTLRCPCSAAANKLEFPSSDLICTLAPCSIRSFTHSIRPELQARKRGAKPLSFNLCRSALLSRRIRTQSRWPLREAVDSAVKPLRFCALREQPASSSRIVCSTFPCATEVMRAVSPSKPRVVSILSSLSTSPSQMTTCSAACFLSSSVFASR